MVSHPLRCLNIEVLQILPIQGTDVGHEPLAVVLDLIPAGVNLGESLLACSEYVIHADEGLIQAAMRILPQCSACLVHLAVARLQALNGVGERIGNLGASSQGIFNFDMEPFGRLILGSVVCDFGLPVCHLIRQSPDIIWDPVRRPVGLEGMAKPGIQLGRSLS